MSLGEMCLCVCDGVSELMQNWKIEREVASAEVKSLWKSRITDIKDKGLFEKKWLIFTEWSMRGLGNALK